MKVTEFSLKKTSFDVKGICQHRGENVLFVDGTRLNNLTESLNVRNHSPDGPAWGYRGSGAAQAALMVCLHIFQNKHLAQELYQSFKEAFVAHWDENGKSFAVQIDLTDFLIENREAFQEAAVQESYEEEQAGWDLLEQAHQVLNPLPQQPVDKSSLNHLPHQLAVGDVVEMLAGFLSTPAGSRAVVFECYGQGGISVISEKGEILGGFSLEEQPRFMKFLYQAQGFRYTFLSVSYLIDDWRNGVFLGVFNDTVADR